MTASPIRWLTVSRTITQIWESTGRLLNAKDVLALGKHPSGLVVDSTHGHVRVSEESLTQYLLLYGRCRDGIPVGEGPEIGDEAEREFRISQADYTDDTPNDEGDEQ